MVVLYRLFSSIAGAWRTRGWNCRYNCQTTLQEGPTWHSTERRPRLEVPQFGSLGGATIGELKRLLLTRFLTFWSRFKRNALLHLGHRPRLQSNTSQNLLPKSRLSRNYRIGVGSENVMFAPTAVRPSERADCFCLDRINGADTRAHPIDSHVHTQPPKSSRRRPKLPRKWLNRKGLYDQPRAYTVVPP